MGNDKCPGPDGFNPCFFKSFWSSCGTDIFEAACFWLDNGSFPPCLNSTNITLIPKGDTQSSMKDWRPISLCNVLYKIVAKVLANRLKVVLSKCISENQSAFVPGRSILDNALAAIEIVHYMQCKTKGKEGDVALKLDISKAYDRIDWDYLRSIMGKMGFCSKWSEWIMMCVESVDYSVILNGEKIGPIIPGRGLRQGDPLSPYLFIICAEGLSSLIRQAEGSGTIRGAKICKNAPIISHLLFADDCFLFFKAKSGQALGMKNILEMYESASGQSINFQKFEVFYSRNVDDAVKASISQILGVQQVMGTGKYLGVPSMVGRSRTSTFKFVKERVWKKINSWSSKCLSQAGRETLIKSVLQSIPSYIMSIFAIPKSIIVDIEKMLNSFWWGHNKRNTKGINWMSWERLSIHKKEGGLGFKNLRAFNEGMLGKQAWKFMTEPHNIVTRLFKAKYFNKCDFLDSKIGHNPSYVWRSIWGAKRVVSEGYKWSIGSGTDICVWDQRWLVDDGVLQKPESLPEEFKELTVADLFISQTRFWNVGLLRNLVSNEDTNRILNTPIFESNQHDRRVWKSETNGIYSVRSGYRISLSQHVDLSTHRCDGNWVLLWNLKVPPKVKTFLWRSCRNALPTRVRLQDRGVNCTKTCALCENEDEDSMHLFFYCTKSKQCWQQLGLWSKVHQKAQLNLSFGVTMFEILQELDSSQRVIWACVMWSIWKQRNDCIWRNEVMTTAAVRDRGLNLLTGWQNAQDSRNRADVQQQRIDDTVWRKPDEGHFKCNVDAAFFKESNRVGIGICIRDDNGRLVKARTSWSTPLLDVPEGEAIGLLYAIRWAKELNLNNITFELDSKRVVDSFHSTRNDVSDLGAIIRECRTTFSSFFTNSRVEFIRRQANEVAHRLARAATFYASIHYFTVLPDCIQDVLINEMR